jgi:hypothetical protein
MQMADLDFDKNKKDILTKNDKSRKGDIDNIFPLPKGRGIYP